MLKSFKLLFQKFRARHDLKRRGIVSPRPLIDVEKLTAILDRSPAPAIFMLVMVWAVSSVLLTMNTRQLLMDPNDWVDGQKAPRSIHANFEFNYIDLDDVEKARRQAEEAQPEFFRINAERSKAISRRFNDYFLQIAEREQLERQGRKYLPASDSEAARLAAETPVGLTASLSSYYSGGDRDEYREFESTLADLLRTGIIAAADKGARSVGQRIRVIDQGGRTGLRERAVPAVPSPVEAAAELAAKFYPALGRTDINTRLAKEFTAIATQLIGPGGNLDYDADQTAQGREEARNKATVPPKTREKGDQLVRKGDTVTPAMRRMLLDYTRIEQQASTIDAELAFLVQNMLWSMVLIIFAAFYLYHLHPEVVKVNKRITLVGLVVILALLANYFMIYFFNYNVSESPDLNGALVADVIPITLAAVLLAVIFGYRVALCAGFFVASITAMMVVPERAFELALKGMVISSLAALAVRSATNYRTYFMRIVGSVFPLTWLLNLNLFNPHDPAFLQQLADGTVLALGNAFVTGLLSLVLIFIFEIVFNVSTNMALMVLCDYNHPLLERLKREAPGTFFHSLMVATLVEDAARAIGANPLKAKAGALFHDIGKLSMPQYFTENNLDSANQHLNLNPQMSSIIIRDHVKEGLSLARQYRMCRTVRDAISQHHGNDLVHYFYTKALGEKRNNNAPVLESQFRYNGEPPQDREMAIISLADACEAASRSLDKPSAAKIEALVNGIFLKRFQDGQLNRAHITLAELDTVRQSFINTLISMKHGRIAYHRDPAEGVASNHESSAQQLGDEASSKAEEK